LSRYVPLFGEQRRSSFNDGFLDCDLIKQRDLSLHVQESGYSTLQMRVCPSSPDFLPELAIAVNDTA
jgi:hypothetical protein